MPAAVINPASARPIKAPFAANKTYIFVVQTNAASQRTGFVELPPNATLSRDNAGTLQSLPVSNDGLSLPPGALPPATTGAAGVALKAAALTAGAASALTDNTGGTPGTTLASIPGTTYATDAALIKAAISSAVLQGNNTRARLEDLIAKLKTAGVLT